MQRSRKAFLRKRTAVLEKRVMGRKNLYKVSLSLVVLLWGVIFLLNSLISQGNGYRDGQVAAVGEPGWHETQPDPDEGSKTVGALPQSEVNSDGDGKETPTSMGEDAGPCTKVLASEDIELKISNPEKVMVADEISDKGLGGIGAAVGESSWHEMESDPKGGSDFAGAFAQSEATSDWADQETSTKMGEGAGPSTEVLAREDIKLNLSTTKNEQVANGISDTSIEGERETPVKTDRLSRVSPPGLDVFKSKLITAKEKHISSQTGAVIHRVEPGGKEYNYASASKGAKVLAFNKEAKGASNILDKDHDKYLRNPCSAEEKYIVIELSEETLVDIIEIANFEHYSSNLKDFELLSSLTYPTDNWVKVGNFTAANVKQAQKFTLTEPKWARYLKVNLVSHYGSEFYCTLSALEVYGVDAVERMLEDLISVENKQPEPEERNVLQIPSQVSTEEYRKVFTEVDNESQHKSQKMNLEAPINTVPDPIMDTKPPQVGRMPGDTVLKILMQKVQTLDVNFSVLEGYLEELNSRYGQVFKEFDDDIIAKDLLLEKVKLAIKNIENSQETFVSDIGELLSWKSFFSSQMNQLVKDNTILRLEVKRILDRQDDMEKKGLAVIFVCFVFGCLAAAQLFIGVIMGVCRVHNQEKLCRTSSGWLLLLLSSSIIAFIQVS